ncbi:MAG: AbrB family transcriptional regulator [Paracoccaceae bacterium]
MVLTLVLSALAGALFNWATMPLPWMLGPMIVTMLAAMMKAPIVPPVPARPYVVVVIGVMLGSGFTPDLIDQAGAWALSMAFLTVYIAMCGLLVVPYYRRVGGFDLVTSYFAGMPGGLNEMMLIGRDMGGNDRAIILAHASRIVVVVALIAIWFRVVQDVDLSDRSNFGTPFAMIPVVELGILLLSGIAGYFLGPALRLPAPTLMGPMLVSAAVHLAGLTDNPPPRELIIVAQVMLGTIIGGRFIGVAARTVLRSVMLSFGATLIMLAITFVFAFFLYGLVGQSFLQVVLAYSPGGLAEMSLVALAMNADIAYVASHHLARITLVVMLAPLIFRLILARRTGS